MKCKICNSLTNKMFRRWYLASECGQHISFYTTDALNIIANNYKCYFYSDGFLHLFSKNKMPNNFLIKLKSEGSFLKKVIDRVIRAFRFRNEIERLQGLTTKDYNKIQKLLRE